MLRLVVDTNVVVSAFLWGGVPGLVLRAALERRILPFTSGALLAELEDVLSRAKLTERLQRTRFSARYLVARYSQMATVVDPAMLSVPSLRDRDDVPVIACAFAARAHVVVSGDADLLSLERYGEVRIVKPGAALRLFDTT